MRHLSSWHENAQHEYAVWNPAALNNNDALVSAVDNDISLDPVGEGSQKKERLFE